MLVRCLYASRAIDPSNVSILNGILATSHRNNVALGITGVLCFDGETFVQLLEGGRQEVSSLYNAIVKDDRHHDIELMIFEEIEQRAFSNWAMGKVDLDKVNPSILLRYSDKPKLDPFRSRGFAVLSLLKELVDTASISIRSS